MTIGRIPSVEGGIQPTIVDAKGDLIAGVAADSINRLAVGSNDQVLVADSSTSTGLAWKSYGAQFVAGKNKIINGDFGVWQRGTSFSTSDAYTADRWIGNSDATFTVSRQTFTPGTAPVAGYEGQFFIRFAKNSGGSYGTGSYQKIEDVRTFAGQTVTLSFWAKADAAVTIAPYYNQVFGSGGSGTVGNAIGSGTTLTTSWARYSLTFTLPSVSGKTIGTGSFLEVYVTRYIGSAATTIDLWGVQLEAGSTATPFTTATGTIQGELAACQRYYYRITPGALGRNFCNGNNESTTVASANLPFPVRMRTNPTAMEQSGTAADYQVRHGSTNTTCNSVPLFSNASTDAAVISFLVASGLTTGQGCQIGPTGANGYLAWSAEL